MDKSVKHPCAVDTWEELLVRLTMLAGEYPDELPTAIVLLDSLKDGVPKFEDRRFF